MIPKTDPLPSDNWIRLAWLFILLGSIGGIIVGTVPFLFATAPWWPALMACSAFGWLLVAAWGPQALTWSIQTRLLRLRRELENLAPNPEEGDANAVVDQVRHKIAKAETRKKRSHWWQMAMMFVGASGAIACWLLAWPKALDGSGLIWFILVALMAFPFLILSNTLAHSGNQSLVHQAGFARFATLSLLVIGLVTAMQGADLPIDMIAGDAPLSAWALRLLAVVHIALASEWIIRTAVSPFLPVRSADRLNSAFILNMLVGSYRDSRAADGFEEQLGIDLSQSWAVLFARRTGPWIFMGMVVATWLTSAVTTLQVDERGLYQRMGHVAAEVMEPGLHIHLPWPLGAVRRISYGEIREVRLNTDGTVEAPENKLSDTGVEDPTDKFDDRIWSKTHGQELFLMIANQPRLSTGNGERLDSQRPYELYHADVVVTYRVGLEATSSRRATYQLSDADTLIAQMGRRELIELFKSRTAEDLLFANFSELSNTAHSRVQDRLTELGTGIDIVDVIFEAVHPPIKTAETFHRVHGAEKEADVLLDIARAEAERIRTTAQIAAVQIHNEANADAVTATARARAEQETFQAERRAYLRNNGVFMFERRLQAIESTFADKNLIIVDPRINAESGLVLDLRETAPDRMGQPQDAENN